MSPGLGWPKPVSQERRLGFPRPRQPLPRHPATQDAETTATLQESDTDSGAAEPGPEDDDDPPETQTGEQDDRHAAGVQATAMVPEIEQAVPPEATTSDLTPDIVAVSREVSRETSRKPWRLPKPPRTRVLVVANQKGGVGKTTTAVNVATALAQGGLRVLVIDLDPQGNASTALGVDHPAGRPGTYEVLIEGAPLAEHLVESPEAPGLALLPATVDLSGAEIQLVSQVARERRLTRALTAYLAKHHADYVFLDCPPSLGLITLNALVAAGEILLPIQCEYYALEGVSQLLTTVDLVTAELNNSLRLSTVMLTMFDARTKLAAQVADEVRAHFPTQTLRTVIPRSVRISEAPSYGRSVLTYDAASAGARAYRRAAEEIALSADGRP